VRQGGHLVSMLLKLGEVIERIGMAELAGVDQAHVPGGGGQMLSRVTHVHKQRLIRHGGES